MPERLTPPPGVVVVDKPADITSHDVVAQARKALHTRKIGHAGTLDPLATGVLVLGVERGTKLLGHLAGLDKTYAATIRLGQSTVTDDADGEPMSTTAVSASDGTVGAAVASFIGEIDQVPSAVSAIKVGGQRAYARVRAGEDVQLAARQIRIDRIEVSAIRRVGDLLDVDVVIDCSSGTYVRAIARDLGSVLGVGGHLTALRRTRVGRFRIEAATNLESLDAQAISPIDDVVAQVFGRRDVDAEQARVVAHGGRLAVAGIEGTYGVYDEHGAVVALMTETGGAARPVAILRPAP